MPDSLRSWQLSGQLGWAGLAAEPTEHLGGLGNGAGLANWAGWQLCWPGSRWTLDFLHCKRPLQAEKRRNVGREAQSRAASASPKLRASVGRRSGGAFQRAKWTRCVAGQTGGGSLGNARTPSVCCKWSYISIIARSIPMNSLVTSPAACVECFTVTKARQTS